MDEMRSWTVKKTRSGKPRVTLYRDGRVVMSANVTTVKAGNIFGRAWAESNEEQ